METITKESGRWVDTCTMMRYDHERHLSTIFALLIGLVIPALIPAHAADSWEAHEAISCNTCHFGSDRTTAAQVVSNCTSCHASGPRSTVVALDFHGNNRRDCSDCHFFHEPGTVRTGLGDLALTVPLPAVAGHCQSCHDTRGDLASLSASHKTAATLYHSRSADLMGLSPSEACLLCHSHEGKSTWQDATGQERLTFSEHASHPFGMAVTAGGGSGPRAIRAKIDTRLPLPDGRLECQTCHLISASTSDLVIPFPQKHDLCLGCHQLRPANPDPQQFLAATFAPVR